MLAASIPLSRLRLLITLAVSQIFGWGLSFDLMGVFGRLMAHDLGMANELAFGGITVMMLIMGFSGPWSGRLIARHGASRILTCGSVTLGAGLVLLSQSTGPISFLGSWAVLGLGGTLGLSVPTYAAVVEREGADSKRLIGILMIFTGLSAAVCWPLAHAMEGWIGWRHSLLAGAALHLFVLAPLHRFGLPRANPAQSENNATSATAPLVLTASQEKRALLALTVISIGFSGLTFGLAPSLITLMQQSGADLSLAVQLASFRSVLGISARAMDVVAGKKASPLLSGFTGAGFMLLSLPILYFAQGSFLLMALFIGAYGIGSGLSAVSRTVLPLSFFSASRFAGISASLALPSNIANALSPVLITALLDYGGLPLVLSFALAVNLLVLAALFTLATLSRTSTALSN
ncbi:MFS transporter [Rhizobium paknamense]|uniref:MFS family arabinose efflux permease n=1 Tax=Rhizobium paknamense TaxID=1206817 RepID=A0ABU0I9I1_9HYPH|nr:MFS transporter [Rhizobium paknamense]MDQ0454283.1 putative MFS family arabinose efflux permease [Rhizobium paknamense]